MAFVGECCLALGLDSRRSPGIRQPPRAGAEGQAIGRCSRSHEHMANSLNSSPHVGKLRPCEQGPMASKTNEVVGSSLSCRICVTNPAVAVKVLQRPVSVRRLRFDVWSSGEVLWYPHRFLHTGRMSGSPNPTELMHSPLSVRRRHPPTTFQITARYSSRRLPLRLVACLA